MTVFVDDVDANADGAKDAYVIYSSEMNAKLYASLLNSDYTGLAAKGIQRTINRWQPVWYLTIAEKHPLS